jgi:hypothetical protein
MMAVMACWQANITRRERRRTLYDGSHRDILPNHVDDGYGYRSVGDTDEYGWVCRPRCCEVNTCVLRSRDPIGEPMTSEHFPFYPPRNVEQEQPSHEVNHSTPRISITLLGGHTSILETLHFRAFLSTMARPEMHLSPTLTLLNQTQDLQNVRCLIESV